MKEEDNLTKKKEFSDTLRKKLESLVKKLREIEESKGKDDITKEKEIIEILKGNIPFIKKLDDELEEAKKKYTLLILIL